MPTSLTRDFNMEDELMLVRANTKYDLLFGGDLAAFTAKFPWLDAAFIASFLTDINTARAFPVDQTVSGNIKVLTADIGSSMTVGMNALRTLDIYAQLAYKTDKVNQRVFGQDKWDVARNDQEKMITALGVAHGFANAAPHKAALMGKGMTQPDIDLLESTGDNIILKNQLQELAIAGRPVNTQQRIQLYNTVFDVCQTITLCSQLVYRDNPAKLTEYNLYPSAGGVSTTVTVKVKTASNFVDDATVTLSNTSLAPKAVDPATGKAEFVSINMPELVDVHVDSPTKGALDIPDNPVTLGDINDIEALYP